MGAVFTRRVVAMKRSRTEVGRWRMLRQVNRRKARWLEAQSRRNMRILAIRKGLVKRQRHALLFIFLTAKRAGKRHRTRCRCRFLCAKFPLHISIGQ